MKLKIQQDTIKLIDNLKEIAFNYGLRNDGNEFKVITQVFLYKFLNDKFGVALKQESNKIAKSGNKWAEVYSNMSDEERSDLLDLLDSDVPILEPKHLLSYLYNNQTKENFGEIFDNTMVDIANKNIDIFATETVEKTKIPLFEKLTPYVDDEIKRNHFARAIVEKLASFSFEEAFDEHYDFFATIFEYLLQDYNTNSGGQYAEYYTPLHIATIMAKLLVDDRKEFFSIECYDPSAGTGTLLMALSHQIGADRCSVYAQDISQRSNKMLKLNLILNGLVSSLEHIIQGDTLSTPFFKANDGKSLKQFDYVVSNPPFQVDFSRIKEDLSRQTARFWAGVPVGSDIYTLFIQHVINSIKDKGKGAIVLPSSFLTAKQGVANNILKYIVDNKIVSGAIIMPSRIFASTDATVAVLFFDKSKQYDNVILIDATELSEEYKDMNNNTKKRLTQQEVELIIDTFKKRKPVDQFSVVLSYDDIRNKNYSLAAPHYFNIKIEHTELTEEEFTSKMNEYKTELEKLFQKSNQLQTKIIEVLGSIKYE